ncbi:Transcriptional regulator containing PAS, AAA-type ATPase, and DNA-binding Fis domains [Acidaminococcus fermentans]|uniref:sigma 54-interacting transcriptional regulator n=1 Tax=Acidaminococcus fermentans TaxID=905 RepID=UPI0008EDF477|nr:sigma 54-interacting transcriptional regulator [Acidaminococcus fermentans]MDD6287508.1 sigma 54-interacting transcriptional regulator [Acidaminococcus fermentans]SFO60416.1 Transcriptional regulator containing PAS, AAA-type ATPase, and DNA-binding Fis domains [Acidaminococcus fermentans]
MEKAGDEIRSRLRNIQRTVASYAGIISKIAGVDVEVVDDNLYRVAGTGMFAAGVDASMAQEGHVYRKVLETGKRRVIYQPGEELVCQGCPNFLNCPEEIELAMPILAEGHPIGVIGLVGSSREQKLHILENEMLFLELIEQIADFISVKAMERERALQREALLSTLNATLEHIQQGILILGKDFRVTDCNRAAMEQLETPNLAGERIFLEATGDNLAKYTEYSLTALGRQYRLMGTYLPVPQPTRDYQSVLIFYRSREIKERYFETAALPAVDKTSILGSSPATLKLKEEISKVARSTSTVLITGESGTGKEMVATSIWRESDRRDKRFIALNCAAIPESIMESELFGYVKGAFTGADPNGRMGKFELANEGVIFLDEIGDMPLYLQSKLLRVLQERKIVRIGSNQLMDIDVRVIAATNKDLKKMVREKRFREDLYYRLDVIPLRVAPLRERLEDIEDLTLFYSQRFARKFGKKAPRLTEEVMDALKGYRWPGNVRELENAVEYMVNLMGEDGTLDVSMLPEDIRTRSREAAAPTENGPGKQTGAGQILSLRELEKNAIRQALLQCGNHTAGKAMAARKLGIGMATLYRKIQQYGL